jgi:hypothetical protein
MPTEMDSQSLTCGCRVDVSRDFLGRKVGTIVEKGPQCRLDDHAAGRVVVMPGRDNARPE